MFDVWILGSLMYGVKPGSIQDLRNKIVSKDEHMLEQEITNSIQSFYLRIVHCQMVKGQLFCFR